MRSRAQAGTSREKCLKLLSGDEAAAVLRELVAAHPHLVPDAVSAANALLAKGRSGLANSRLQPLGHLTPDLQVYVTQTVTRKRSIRYPVKADSLIRRSTWT